MTRKKVFAAAAAVIVVIAAAAAVFLLERAKATSAGDVTSDGDVTSAGDGTEQVSPADVAGQADVADVAGQAVVADGAGQILKDGVVRPLPVSIDVNSLQDGIYPVAFDPAGVEKTPEGCSIEFEVFNMDLYDAVELHLMQVGNYIEVAGKLIRVDSLQGDGNVIVNGGEESGGAEFISIGGGAYRYFGMDDIATYTSFGKVRLTVPSSVDFVDNCCRPDSRDALVVGGAQLHDYLKGPGHGSFSQYEVKIRIEAGRIVEFWREYRP